VNKTILKPSIAAAAGCANTYTWDFPDVKYHIAVLMLKTKKAIRFRHPDYNPDRTQKLISSSMSQHLLTCNVSMHALLSNLDNRQTDKHLQKHLPPPLSEVKLIRSFLDINPATDLGFLNLKSD